MKSAKECALHMSETLNEIELKIIENGEDDWVLFAHIMGIVEEARGILLSEELAEELASTYCLGLCAKGLAQLGRYVETHPVGFAPWSETGVELEAKLKLELATPPAGCDAELNLQRIMLDILPAGLETWKRHEALGS